MNQIQKTNRMSAVFLGSMLLLALQLFTGKANATIIPTDSFGCTQSITFTSSCVTNGYYANNWVGAGKRWIWKVNTDNFASITMTFNTTKSAAGGPTSGQIYYSTVSPNGPWTAVTGGSFTVSTSCATKNVTLPAGCEDQPVLYVSALMSGATVTTSTNRITAANVFNGTTTGCTLPPAGGTAVADNNPVCAGTPATISLTGAAGGAGISYQWQSSLNGSSWTNIPGATGATYTNAGLNDTIYYRALVTCSGDTSLHVPSNAVRVDVLVPTVAAISGYTAPLTIGAPQTLTDATADGLWISSDESVATIDDLGSGMATLTGLFGGVTDISYQVTDLVTGCIGTQTITVNTVWPNTIALYAGSTGTNTNVIPVPGDHVSTLYATGFGSATPCGSGGLSGLTLDADVDTAFNENGPHAGYMVYADPDSVLNMYRIQARARVSGNGPTKAVIAYQSYIGGVGSGWVVSADTVDLVSSSCGVMSNVFDFQTGIYQNPNPTVNGMDSLEVAVFPWSPVSDGGTFQLGSLEVYGVITNNDLCTGAPITTTADSALPAVVTICDSGFRYLNYNLGTGGVAGVEISYQWQSSPDNSTWTDVLFAEGAVYKTDTLHAGMTSDTTYYRVQVLCSGNPVGESASSMVVVSPTPANAGTISGIIDGTGSLSGLGRMFIDSTYTLTSSIGTGGTWSSNDTSVISIDPISGVATPHIPGDAIFTYRKAVGGCFGSSKDTAISLYRNTKALYVGKGGNTTNIYRSSDVAAGTSASLITANWGAAATCGNGGISGLTNTTTAQNDATNGSVVMSIQSSSAVPVSTTQIRATVRKQPSGAYKAYLGYRTGAGAWTLSAPVDVESDDCGYSHNEITFAAPVMVDNSTNYDFAVFGYNGTATTTLQVNSISVIGTGGGLNRPTGINDVNVADNIQLYPNPVENTLNIDANEVVNVTIFSIDGKKLLEQKNAKSINVNSLVSGMYLIQVSNQNNMLLKTEKFIKK